MTAGPVWSIRLRSTYELVAIREAARDVGMSPSQWARAVLLAAAGIPDDEPESAEAGRRLRAGEPDPWRTKGDD